MINSRKLLLFAAASVAAGSFTMIPPARSADASPSAELRAPNDTEADSLYYRLVEPSTLGLKPRTGGAKHGIDLPFGMNYNWETKILMMPLDQKSEWGVGLNLNLNSAPASLEQSPSSGIGLQPRRTPGVTLQKKF
jgi:hypothetical protein